MKVQNGHLGAYMGNRSKVNEETRPIGVIGE